jgi:DNA-binding XRE family transcriptional regulator
MDGEALKVIRKGYKLTQAAMAEKLKVSRQSYIAWEKGTYKIPEDIVTRLIAGDVAMPQQVEDATALITVKNHPECFIEDGDDLWFSLAHPRWYNSGDCPLRHKVPKEMKAFASVAELATHVVLSMETVVDLLLQNWPDAAEIARYRNNGWQYESNCKGYLKRHNRPDLLDRIPHDATFDTDTIKREPIELPPMTPEEEAGGFDAIADSYLPRLLKPANPKD